jgi:hypothetical protein
MNPKTVGLKQLKQSLHDMTGATTTTTKTTGWWIILNRRNSNTPTNQKEQKCLTMEREEDDNRMGKSSHNSSNRCQWLMKKSNPRKTMMNEAIYFDVRLSFFLFMMYP